MRTLVGVIAVSALVLTGCGSIDSKAEVAAESTTTTVANPQPATATPSASGKFEPLPGTPQVGEAVTNGGAKITVNSVTSTPTISFRPGAIAGEYAPKEARDGGQFIVVDATVENVGKASMDLTCSYPIATMLGDDEKRQFDAIKDLHRVEGNPECNVGLQPGFSSEMKWVYEIPSTTVPVIFAFYTTEEGSTRELRAVAIGPIAPA